MAEKIKISQDEFQKAAIDLKSFQNSLERHKAEMQKKYSDMGASWKGAAGVAFGNYSQKIITIFDKNIKGLEQLIMAMQNVREESTEVDQELAKSTVSPIFEKQYRF